MITRKHFVLLTASFLVGCAGPPALDRVIWAQHDAEYSQAAVLDPDHPREAWLLYQAEELSLTSDEAESRDLAFSADENPFDARTDLAAISRGAVVYREHCASCHGTDARGRGPKSLPDYPAPDWHSPIKRFAITTFGGAAGEWFARIHDGYGPMVEYSFGKRNAMPAFKDRLTREQIWLAVTYLQSLEKDIPDRD